MSTPQTPGCVPPGQAAPVGGRGPAVEELPAAGPQTPQALDGGPGACGRTSSPPNSEVEVICMPGTMSYLEAAPARPRGGRHSRHRRGSRAAYAARWVCSVAAGAAAALRLTGPRPAPVGQHTRHPDTEHAPLLAPATFSHAPDLDITEIDPAQAVTELAASAAPARTILDLLHDAYPDLPRDRVRWTVHDDGASGVIDSLEGDEDDLRGIVATYAAALAVQPAERSHTSGHVIVSASGTYLGARVAVEATCARPVDEHLLVFQQAALDPSLDDPATVVFPVPAPAVREPLALPAAREAL